MTDSTTRSPRTPDSFRDLFSDHSHDELVDVLYEQTQVAVEAEAAAPDAGLRERIVALMNKTIAESSWSVSLDDIRAALAAHRSSEPSPAHEHHWSKEYAPGYRPANEADDFRWVCDGCDETHGMTWSAPPKVKRTPSGFRFIEDGADPADLDTVKRTINDEYRKRHAAPEFRDLMPDEEWRDALGAAGLAVDPDILYAEAYKRGFEAAAGPAVDPSEADVRASSGGERSPSPASDGLREALAAAYQPNSSPQWRSGYLYAESVALGAAGPAVDVDRLAEVLEEMQAPMAAGMAYLALPIPEHDWNPSDPTERLHDARAVAERIAAGLTRPDPTPEERFRNQYYGEFSNDPPDPTGEPEA